MHSSSSSVRFPVSRLCCLELQAHAFGWLFPADFVSIFVRILVILMKNSDKKKDRSETNNNRRR